MLVEIERFVYCAHRRNPGYAAARDQASVCYTCPISVER